MNCHDDVVLDLEKARNQLVAKLRSRYLSLLVAVLTLWEQNNLDETAQRLEIHRNDLQLLSINVPTIVTLLSSNPPAPIINH